MKIFLVFVLGKYRVVPSEKTNKGDMEVIRNQIFSKFCNLYIFSLTPMPYLLSKEGSGLSWRPETNEEPTD